MAQRARQCAAQVGVTIALRTSDPVDFGGARFLSVTSREKAPKANPPLASIVSHGPDDIKDKGAPSFYTALEMLAESAHSSFWEVSTQRGDSV